MQAFPVLYTARLVLRQLSADDIPALLIHVNNRKITDQIINFPFPFEEYHAVHRLSYIYNGFRTRTHYVFAIIFRPDENEEFAGEISLHVRASRTAELGYWVAEPLWNKGITTEAIGAITRFGFEQIGLREIYAECGQENTASRVVLEKNQFVREQQSTVIRYINRNPAMKHEFAQPL